MMNQTIEQWLWLGEEARASLDLQLAQINLGSEKRTAEAGAEKVLTESTATPTKEFIFLYQKKPGEQVSRVESGEASGLQMVFTREGSLLVLDIRDGKKSWQHRCRADELPKQWTLAGTEWSVQLSDYWPDFSVKDGVPISVSDEPDNPAVLVEVTRNVAAPAPAPVTPGQASPAASASAVGEENWLHIHLSAPDKTDSWNYQLSSRQQGESEGELKVGSVIETGWADWTMTVLEILPQARADYQFQQAEAGVKGVPGLQVRLSRNQGEDSIVSWVPMGWQIDLPVQDEWIRVLYGRKSVALPFVLRLEDFEMKRNPGSMDPASFTSFLEVMEPGRGLTRGFCTMNEPMNYPDALWRSLTGWTYKLSQAGWNPEDLNQSSIQILRDPGWLFKWVGSLTFCIGVFCLFYMKPAKVKKNSQSSVKEGKSQA
jgi:hypothetical protein